MSRFLRMSVELLHRPGRVFVLCLIFVALSMVVDGSLFHLWSLYRDHQMLEERIALAKDHNKSLERQIKEAAQPAFIERQVRDQFDLVKDGDMVFVFADDLPGEP